MNCRELYMRQTDVNGIPTFSRHRVWDADRFIASRVAEAAKANAEVKGDGPKRASAQAVTKDQWRRRSL